VVTFALPSPKSHSYVVAFVEVLVKVTEEGASNPLADVKLNFATGGIAGSSLSLQFWKTTNTLKNTSESEILKYFFMMVI
jgi:hypothetical protein